jgi:hypothetical protein
MKPKSTEVFIPGPAGRLEGKYYNISQWKINFIMSHSGG